MDYLLKRSLKIAQPPVNISWNRQPWAGIYELLFGGAFSLCSSRFPIEGRVDSMREYSTRIRANLVKKLKPACKENYFEIPIKEEIFFLWSAGYFLNKAQYNAASAIDRTVNSLIHHQLPSIEESIQHLSIYNRAFILADLNYSYEINKYSDKLLKGAKDWPHIDGTRFHVIELAKQCYPSCKTLRMVLQFVSREVSKEAAVFGSWERFNWEKHHRLGAFGRTPTDDGSIDKRIGPHVTMVEWALTLLALEFAKSFWEDAVQHYRRKAA